MAVYVFGDTHGTLEIDKIFPEKFPEGKDLTENDYVIVLGDWGIPFITHGPNWYFKTSDKTAVKILNSLPFTILFVDGNHDNHNFWEAQPRERGFGGTVQKLRGTDRVYHLMRGEYYTIDGHTFWVMGGAKSTDAHLRTFNVTWWEQEVPNAREMQHGVNTLIEHNGKVDYILTHTVPELGNRRIKIDDGSTFQFYMNIDNDPTRIFLRNIAKEFRYSKWFAGHYHIDANIPEMNLYILYNKYIKI